MLEAFLQFIKEVLFRNETLDIRDKNFDLLQILVRAFIILSFVLNYYLLNHFYKLAKRHYELETAITILESSHKECTINYQVIDKK